MEEGVKRDVKVFFSGLTDDSSLSRKHVRGSADRVMAGG